MLHDEEEEYKDNMPENLQSSERYEKAEAAVDALGSAVSSLEEVLDYIEEAQERQSKKNASKNYTPSPCAALVEKKSKPRLYSINCLKSML